MQWEMLLQTLLQIRTESLKVREYDYLENYQISDLLVLTSTLKSLNISWKLVFIGQFKFVILCRVIQFCDNGLHILLRTAFFIKSLIYILHMQALLPIK